MFYQNVCTHSLFEVYEYCTSHEIIRFTVRRANGNISSLIASNFYSEFQFTFYKFDSLEFFRCQEIPLLPSA